MSCCSVAKEAIRIIYGAAANRVRESSRLSSFKWAMQLVWLGVVMIRKEHSLALVTRASALSQS